MDGEWWNAGGGGTVWDSIVYDTDLDQLYIGVGNGSPWNRRVRSPQEATIYSSRRSWHLIQIPAHISGTFRRPPLRHGITRPLSPSC